MKSRLSRFTNLAASLALLGIVPAMPQCPAGGPDSGLDAPPPVTDLTPAPAPPDFAVKPKPPLDLAVSLPDLAQPRLPDLALPPPPPPPPPADMSVPAGGLPASFVGLTIHDATTNTPWPTIPFGAVRLWDTHTSWAQINTSSGVFNWALLDKYVALAQQHHVDVLYTVALTPQWASSHPSGGCAYGSGQCDPPSNLNDYQTFVAALVTRYKGKIKFYEGWNEPNLSGQFFNGQPFQIAQMQQILFQAVKKIDPAATVLSPCPTTLIYSGADWFDRFLNAGGQGFFDAVAFHLYTWPDSPEAWSFKSGGNLDAIRAVLIKHGLDKLPQYNTEAGWNIGQPSDALRSAYIARMYLLSAANNLASFFFYAWDDNNMGVQGTSAGAAIGTVSRWLTGSRGFACNVASGVYTCPLILSSSRPATIAWSTTGSGSFRSPSNASIIERLDGSSAGITAGSSVALSNSPVLVR